MMEVAYKPTEREQSIAQWTCMAEHFRYKDMDPADRLLYEKAQDLTCEAIRLYMSSSMPYVTGAKRERWLVTKLKKIRERYLEPFTIF